MRYDRAVQEAFYWGEIMDNGGTFADFGEIPSPGTLAALSGLWRGRNRADNEDSEQKQTTKVDLKEREERRRRYSAE